MVKAWVAGVGVRGPGLDGWARSRAVLAGLAPFVSGEVVPPPPAALPANERRRAGLPVRLALAVAGEAVAMSGLSPDAVRGVFGSANGEGAILGGLLETLAADAALSPTQFHNSVHNAVAGYWTVAAGSRQPMTCLGAHADTFAAALLKALAEMAAEQAPVLLCVYDVPLPAPLAAKQPTGCAFACALVLTPASGFAELRARWQPDAPGDDAPDHPALAALSAGNPAARALRLLQALARGQHDRMAFGLLDGALVVEVGSASTSSAQQGAAADGVLEARISAA